MKKLLLTALVILIAGSLFGQTPTTFILVRHSEKASDGTNDPSLSQPGLERSNNLAALLIEQEISALFSTPYKRTKATLTPIAREKGLEVKTYDPYAGDKMLKEAMTSYSGGTIVVSGHSNTIPNLANALLGDVIFSQFDDNDYSNLIIIVASEMGKGKLIHLNF